MSSTRCVVIVSACAFMSLVALPPGRSAAGELPQFDSHALDAESTYCAAAVVDVNGDGKRDVISGGAWFSAPDWKRHKLREVEQIRGRFDDYSNLPLDVNGDGRIDLVSANYRSELLYWVENIGTRGEWPRHVIDQPGPSETGRLADIDGDGDLDLLPNGTQYAAWWELVTASSGPHWVRHDLPPELAGHGLGFGDINGDGRGDVVCPRGWAEAPEDRRGGRWLFHADWRLHRDGSIPILVLDVDADGDSDLVWGRGHHHGLYWLEQRVLEGKKTFVQHAIDTSWSQAHSLLLADLDRDGQIEIIAGKRYLGHDGRDIGEYDPLGIFAYQFDRETRSFRRTPIATGGRVGFGLDPKAEDLDGDGDLDLICPGRSGLFWLENRLGQPDRPAEGKDGSEFEESRLKAVLRTDELRTVESAADLATRRQQILAGMAEAMGPLPDPHRRVPLEMEILAREETEKYQRLRIAFTPEPGDRVPAYLLLPKNLQGPTAAMLCLHQTTGIGKGEPAGLGGLKSLHYAHELANLGFVCLVPDYPSFGDYPYDFRVKGAHYQSGSMKAIWNNLRAVDLLESLPEVDPDRLGCIGHSLGGHNSLFTAAFDQRLKAVVTSCGFTAFHHYYEGKLAGWTSDRYMPRIRDVYGNDPNRVPFDFYGVLAAIAPRGIFVNAPLHDSNFENVGVKKVMATTEAVHQVLGTKGRVVAVYPDCGHDFPDDIRREAYAWLSQQLQK